MKNEQAKLLKTVGLFSSLVIVLNLAVWKLGSAGHMYFFERFTAQSAGTLINISGIRAGVEGATISLPGEIWLVNTECTALFVIIIFASFILAFPARLKQKLVACLAGIPAIIAINILRLLALAWLARLGRSYEDYFHDYIWQAAFILIVVFFWLIWIEKVASSEGKTSISG
jgi:archaeosortase B (VPXXXP-CTERM-specific)